MKFNNKMLWGYLALAAVIGIVAVIGAGSGLLVLIVACTVMMGAMMWMMMGGMGGGTRGDQK